MKTTLLSMALVSFAAAASAQNAPDLQTSAYRNSIAQDEVRKQAEQARAQLQLLLEDFQQNGLTSTEFAQVQQTVAKLSSLSDEEILPLVQMLKEVGSQQQASDAEGKLATASQTQKNIQFSLKALSDHLALQMNESSMEKRLQALVLSQTGNLRQTKELAVSGKPANKLPRELAPLYTLSQSDQASIKQETDLMLATLEKVVAGAPEGVKSPFAAALDESKKSGLSAMAAVATADLSGGKFPEAMGSEGRLLDGLQAMLMKIRENQPVQKRVEAMANKLQQLAAAQGELAQATEKADVNGQKDLQETQKKLSNEVAALKKELTGLNAPASTQADAAEKAMEAAEDKLDDKSAMKKDEKSAIAKAQADAAAKLQAAGDALQNQAKKMADSANANAPKTPADALQALSQLDQQVKDALAKQNALDSAPNAAAPGAQQKLAEDTAKMQQDALTSSPQAAQQLGQAAAQMAQQDPNTPQANTPAQALAQASAEIQNQMAAVQQAVDKQAALQAMAAPIQAANNQAKQAAQTMDKTPNDLSPAVKQMMDAQQTLNQVQNAAANGPTDVPAALKEAQAQLESSVLEAAQSKGQQAAAANAKAQGAMDKALQSLNQAMAAAQAEAAAAAPAMAGQPTPGQPTPGQPGAPMPGQGTPTPSQNPNAMAQNGTGGLNDQGVQGFMGSSGGSGTQGQVTTGIKPKDRAAVSLLQKEKAPAEYQDMVQQYLKNLAEGAAPGHGVQ